MDIVDAITIMAKVDCPNSTDHRRCLWKILESYSTCEKALVEYAEELLLARKFSSISLSVCDLRMRVLSMTQGQMARLRRHQIEMFDEDNASNRICS